MNANMNIAIVKSAAARLVLLGALVVTGAGLVGCDCEQAATLVSQLGSASASSRSSVQAAADSPVKPSERSRPWWPGPPRG
ncbi:MAG: hypothetical protein U1D55_02635 [Phycisphaerae bacterium]